MWMTDDTTRLGAERTLCVYGPSQSGKTTQLGVLAERIFRQTQKKSRLYMMDPGGYGSILPYVKVGILEVVDLVGRPRPWEWMDQITKGGLPVVTNGKESWQVRDPKDDSIAGWFFDSMTGGGDVLMSEAAKAAATGRNIGGQPPNFKLTEGTVTVAGNSPSHYGSVQGVMAQNIKQSFLLPGTVVWTATSRSAQDEDGQGVPTMIGPQLVGKALTAEIPRWFNYTFRLVTIPGSPALNKKEEHRLYLRPLQDATTGAAGAILTNNRAPLDSANDIPEFISPASIDKALDLLENAGDAAEAAIRARLAGILPAQ
jgi:hypothetical protein